MNRDQTELLAALGALAAIALVVWLIGIGQIK